MIRMLSLKPPTGAPWRTSGRRDCRRSGRCRYHAEVDERVSVAAVLLVEVVHWLTALRLEQIADRVARAEAIDPVAEVAERRGRCASTAKSLAAEPREAEASVPKRNGVSSDPRSHRRGRCHRGLRLGRQACPGGHAQRSRIRTWRRRSPRTSHCRPRAC